MTVSAEGDTPQVAQKCRTISSFPDGEGSSLENTLRPGSRASCRHHGEARPARPEVLHGAAFPFHLRGGSFQSINCLELGGF